jgi:hypothetical protein
MMKNRILFQVSILLFAATINHNAGAQCVPAGNGTNGGISCIYPDSILNRMFVGGGFQYSGSDTLNRCGFWNDSTIRPMRMMGNIGVNDSVWCFAHFNGSLYAGGSFTQAGGLVCNHIAQWDGTSWHAVGSGFNQPVHSLMAFNGKLYAGGEFTASGSTMISHMGQWNGVEWLQTGGGTDDDVEVLCVWNGALYLGGEFTMAGGMAVNNICKWDGTAFSAVGSGFTSGMMGRSMVHSLCIYNGNLYAGGMFRNAGAMGMQNLARWDGSAWSTIGGIGGAMMGEDAVSAMCAYNGQLYVGGNFGSCGSITANNLGSWNGSSWSTIGTGMNGKVNSLAVYHGKLYIAGEFTSAAGTSVNNIASYSISSGTQPVQLNEGSLTLYPNPATDRIQINWNVEKSPADTKIFISDLAGKIIFRQNPGKVSAGLHHETISVHEFSAGTYFLTIQSGTVKKTVKFQVEK